MYIIKIKGKAKIPDYVQIRDEAFTLLAYVRADRPEKGIQDCGLGAYVDQIKEQIESIPFGKVTPLKLG